MSGNRLARVLERLGADLDTLGAAWGRVGGLAVSTRAEPRFTRDLDVAVAVADDGAAEELVRGLMREGYQPATVLEQDAVGRMAMVRVIPPSETSDGVVVDLLFASSGIEPEIAAAAQRMEVMRGVTAPVAMIGHLLALELLARDDLHRPQDAPDLRSLLQVADQRERTRAASAVRTIKARGYDRGRDLEARLAELMGASSQPDEPPGG